MATRTPYVRGGVGRFSQTPYRRIITPGRSGARISLYSSTPGHKVRAALAAKEQQCEDLRKKLSLCTASKQKLKGKLYEVVERQGELKQRFQELKDKNFRKEELCQALRAELNRSSQDAEQRSVQAAAEMDALSEELHAKDEVINSLQRELRTARSCLAGREQGQVVSTSLACEVRELQNRVSRYERELQSAEKQIEARDDALAVAAAEHEDLLEKYKALAQIIMSARATLSTAVLHSGTTIAVDETKRAVRGIANSIMSLRHSLPSLGVSGNSTHEEVSDGASSCGHEQVKDAEVSRHSQSCVERNESSTSQKSSQSIFRRFSRPESSCSSSTSSQPEPAARGQTRRWFRGDAPKVAHSQSPDTAVLESQVFMPLGGGALMARHSSMR